MKTSDESNSETSVTQSARPLWLAQHVDEITALFESRALLLRTSAHRLADLQILDERMDAHLDGVRISGAQKWPILLQALDEPSPALIYLATIMAVEARDTHRLQQLLALAETLPELRSALLQALTWIAPDFTQPLVQPLLNTQSTFCWRVALHLLRQHQTHADTLFEWALSQPDQGLQATALNATAEIGLMDLLPCCQRLLQSVDPEIRFLAARAGVLLGDRNRSLVMLREIAVNDSPWQYEALSLLTLFLPVPDMQHLLTAIARQGGDARILIQLAGMLGSTANIPSLLRLMENPAFARLAGYAFCTITGLDLVEQGLEVEAPEDSTAGPNDDPEDDAVESDPDDALPWPDVKKLAQWWSQNGAGFAADTHYADTHYAETRYLFGGPITRERCLQLLQHGWQSQRRMAALYLKVMAPASPLFPVDVPAWRQQARLDGLSVPRPSHPYAPAHPPTAASRNTAPRYSPELPRR